MVEFLLENGAQCHVHPYTGHSPLHAACMAGNLPCAEKVLKVIFILLLKYAINEVRVHQHLGTMLSFPFPHHLL